MPRPARTDPRVDLVLAVICGAASLACLVLPASSRSSAAATLRGTLVAPLAGLQEKAELSRRAFLAHDAAVRVADSVTLRSQRLSGVEEENERLRKLLGLGSAMRWGFVPAEALQGRGVGDEFTVPLSAGRRSGVVPLAPVVVSEGLVGFIELVDESLSIAILWPHADFRVSAMAVDGSAYGIVAAHAGTGAARYLLELRSVPVRSQLKAGALIVSSGLGGVYPKGIPVGTVVSELRTAEGYARTYLLRPVVKLPDVTSVLILLPSRASVGTQNVWQLGTATDSATKGAVAAGDSLVLRARAAQRAKADSVAKARADSAAKTKLDSSAKAKPDSALRVKRDTTRRPP